MDTPEGTWTPTRTPSSRPGSHKSARSSRSTRSPRSSRTTEQTPLLAREDRSDDEEEAAQTPARRSLLSSLSGASTVKASTLKKRWPSIVALIILCIVVVIIMLGFLATEGLEEYATQAADFKPKNVSLDSLTTTGARVQVRGEFTMDGSKVRRSSVRNLGRFGTWIAREAESDPTEIDVYLPEYGNSHIGTAKIPGIKVNVRDGHTTDIDFVTDLEPNSPDAIRNIANDWLEGRLGQIRLKGKAEVQLKSGIVHLGKQILEKTLVVEGNNLPAFPKYNITKLNIREAKDGGKGMGADASLLITNEYPVDLSVPPVAVDVLVDGCSPSDAYIKLGTAQTPRLHVVPETDVQVNVTGRVKDLPDALTEACPNSVKSPLDTFLGNYMHGEDATIYINCCKFPDPETPQWTRDLLKDITVPIPFAGRDMDNLIKNFSLTDVHFHLPDMLADPGTPESQPKISAIVKVEVGLPDEMNFPLDVDKVKAKADVFYKGENLGILHLEKWQRANSTRVEPHNGEGPSLLVQSDIKKAPLEVTDDDLFSEVVQALIFGEKSIILTVKAAVSVGVDSPIGKFVVREIPAEGVVPVKPIGDDKGDGNSKLGSLSPKVGNLSILETSKTSITLGASVNLTNPTKYSATVPYFNINILVNDTILGQATAKNVVITPGNNTNIQVTAVWDPSTNSGAEGKDIGREMLSQYISGFNTSLTLQTHNGSVPSQPSLGFALSHIPIKFPTPHLATPKQPSDDPDDGDDDDDKKSSQPHFIRSATMHIISSTAIFTLSSPLSSTILYLTHLNATSFYRDHPAGKILYDLPFAVPPGLSDSPSLPVDWSLGSVGYEAIKKALGGTLKLSAYAEVGVRIGKWEENIWYKGRGIGAKIRL